MPFGHNVHFLRQRELVDKKARKDLEEAFLHNLERNRKLEAQLTSLRNAPPRERFRDQVVTMAMNLLPPVKTRTELDSDDRASRQVREISDLQAQVISLHTKLQEKRCTIEQLQVCDLQHSNSVLHKHLHDHPYTKSVAEITVLRKLLAERTDQNNSLLAALDGVRQMPVLTEQQDEYNRPFPTLAQDRANRMV